MASLGMLGSARGPRRAVGPRLVGPAMACTGLVPGGGSKGLMTDSAQTAPAVAILAGGRSRRMGRDKALLQLGSSTLLKRVLAAVAPLGSQCMLIANATDAFSGFGVPVHPDLRPGCGPLGGLHTALALSPTPSVLFLACDLPFLTKEFLRFLLSELGEHHAVVPRSAEGLQPLCAVYARACLPAVERALDRRELRMTAFFADVDVRILEPPQWQGYDRRNLLFTNLNTPEEYQRALQLIGEESGRDDGSPG